MPTYAVTTSPHIIIIIMSMPSTSTRLEFTDVANRSAKVFVADALNTLYQQRPGESFTHAEVIRTVQMIHPTLPARITVTNMKMALTIQRARSLNELTLDKYGLRCISEKGLIGDPSDTKRRSRLELPTLPVVPHQWHTATRRAAVSSRSTVRSTSRSHMAEALHQYYIEFPGAWASTTTLTQEAKYIMFDDPTIEIEHLKRALCSRELRKLVVARWPDLRLITKTGVDSFGLRSYSSSAYVYRLESKSAPQQPTYEHLESDSEDECDEGRIECEEAMEDEDEETDVEPEPEHDDWNVEDEEKDASRVY